MSTAQAQANRVSTLELFFDLVFVFTITQLTTVLVKAPTWRGLAQVVLMLGVIFWMYGGYAWLTNAVAPDRASRRLLLLGGMGAYLILALAIPRAFGDTGTAFGLAYLAVVSVHIGLFAWATSTRTLRSVVTLAPLNFVSALLVLAGGIAGGTAQYVLWGLAFLLEWSTPKLINDEGFEIGPAHFVERHGLVVIVAIGESIVAIGIGAAGLSIDAALVGVALFGLALSACLWWTYFGGDDERAERALADTPPALRPRMAVNAFGYWHLPILFGVVAIAAGEKKAIGHASDPLTTAQALQLAGGVAVFMVGDVLFRRSLGIARGGWRAAAAVLALATIPLATELSAFVQLSVLVAMLGGALLAEYAAARPDPARLSPPRVQATPAGERSGRS